MTKHSDVNRRAQRGFTLIEVLIAVTIFTICTRLARRPAVSAQRRPTASNGAGSKSTVSIQEEKIPA